MGQGQAYYIGTRTDGDLLADFYGALSRKLSIPRDLDGQWPEGVGVRKRTAGGRDFVFLMNFNNTPAVVTWQDPALHPVLSRASCRWRRLPDGGDVARYGYPDAGHAR